MNQTHMNQTLLFRCLDSGQIEWLADDTVQRGSLAEMASRAGGRRLVMAVPGETVTLVCATAPDRNRRLWLKALPYALEDSLAEDVDNLHFALGEARAGATAPVAVVRHATLRGWLDACAQAGVTPVALIPDPLLLPYQEGAWSVLMDGERAVVRCGEWAGFAIERDELAPFMATALTEAGAQAPAYLQAWGDIPTELAASIEVRPQPAPAETLRVFAAGYAEGTALNLLQGPYSQRANLGKWLRPWRAAAILAGLWLGTQAALQAGEYWQLQREQSTLQTAMERLYRETVPGAHRIVNPRVQLENRLRELRQSAGVTETALLDLLYRGGQPLVETKAVNLRGLRYKDNQLDLDLEGGSLEALDQLKQRFGPQNGLDAQMRTTKREGKVESLLTLKRITP